MELLDKIESLVWGIPLIMLLSFLHFYFTIKLDFPQKDIFKGIKNLFKKNTGNNSGITPFASLMSVLASTIGAGNIIGVAASIIVGGPGSIFWMFLIGIFATATKYAETFIVLKYRVKNKGKQNKKVKSNIAYTGGAMYVLENQLGKKGLAILFSIFTILSSFGIGCMIQSNSISNILYQSISIPLSVSGIMISMICAYILFGGLKRISKISSIVVPITTLLYIFSCIWILVVNREGIAEGVCVIIEHAFGVRQIMAGSIIYSIFVSIRVGISKGIFSNEAGMGSSPILEASTNVNSIKDQSLTSSLGVVIDTVILCTLTGITIMSTGLYATTDNPIELVNIVFNTIPYGKEIITILLAIFVIATIPGWEYFGEKAYEYLRLPAGVYKLVYILFIFLGAIIDVSLVWAISSIANAFMILPNVYMMWRMRKEIIEDGKI